MIVADFRYNSNFKSTKNNLQTRKFCFELLERELHLTFLMFLMLYMKLICVSLDIVQLHF